jgi:Protein of unknown function (DUF3108)
MLCVRHLPLAPLLALALLAPLAPAAAQDDEGCEVLEYHWELKGFVGTLARIFFPGSGEGSLVTCDDSQDPFKSELRLTSKRSADDFWVYGARIDRARVRPLEVWNESRYKQRERRREAHIEAPDVLDVPSSIYLLRHSPPGETRRFELWSDGNIYSVIIEPQGKELRRVGGRQRLLDSYSVRSADDPGARKWEGSLALWTTLDADAIPVEILFRRGGAKVLLTLVSPDPDELADPAPVD